MEEDEDMSTTPFWLRNSGSFGRQSNRLRRSSSSVFFSSGAFVLALLAIALVFIFFVIPSILSFTSQIFRPQLVKKSWDSLNLVLVLFAIVCGFLSRNTSNDNNISTPKYSPTYSYDQVHHQTVFNAPSDVSSSQQEVQKSNPSTPRQWYDQYADRTAYNDTSFTSSMNRGGVRASSSYPDLRQQESTWNVTRDEGWQFYDDTGVANYRASGSDHLHHHRRHRSWHDALVQPPPVQEGEESVQTKNIQVDTYVIRPEQIPTAQSNPPPPSPPRSPSPPPRKEKRTYHALGGKEHSSTNDNTDVKKNLPPAPPSLPPPSPPSPPPLLLKDVESKRSSAGKNVKKRGVATTKEFIITSLKKNKKKQRHKSVENFETLLATASSAPSSLLPPPPPPPPPPPSVFHNLFSSKKSNKPKKTIHSIPSPPPSAPPGRTTTTRLSKTKPQVRPMMTTEKPPLPVKMNTFVNADDENASSGGESPLVGIPPPPPLPPFGLPEMKYAVVHGDYVRIKSDNSSRSGSPDLDDDQDSIPSPTNAMETSGRAPSENGESPKAMFCPSPDVNTKADTFIARFRAGLRLEKMNSVRGRSNLGPDPREGEGPSY